MAGADYYSCDVCGAKTFYDAPLDYRDPEDADDLITENPRTHHPWPIGVGDMAALCVGCAKTHRITIKLMATT